MGNDEHANLLLDRRNRRYGRLAALKLPDWVPDALVRKLAQNMSATALARQYSGLDELIAQPHPDCSNPSCPHCKPTDHQLQRLERERMRLLRLATYPDMRRAWKVIATQDRRGPLTKKRWAQNVKGDSICGLLLTEIDSQLKGDFTYLPKQSATQTKKSAQHVAKLARQLIDAINGHEGGPGLAADFLCAHFAARNLSLRAKDGETRPLYLAFVPAYSWPSMTYEPDQRESGYDDPDDEPLDTPPWNELPAVDRLRWLCDEVRDTSLCDLLSAFANEMDGQASATPQIARPRSGDPRVRVLTKALSDWMHGWYGSPLDDVVACFVSAILDLREPLTRDDVRPLRKRAAGT
ncbi:hypothetical protein [Paraburkholderia adhaesiva]|uniref:hypothetical protein n=1 Tax=Paraburkholderia adhaesiva TaxID=2883244 RepID=UPI001F203DB2|nr:hypothetical protein [Paraburkholderia adhaesiva]